MHVMYARLKLEDPASSFPSMMYCSIAVRIDPMKQVIKQMEIGAGKLNIAAACNLCVALFN